MRIHTLLLSAAAACLVAASIAPPAAAQTASGSDVICRAAKTVAASVYGLWMGSQGDPSLVPYQFIVSNIGNAWNGSTSTFTAPCSGTYTFNVTFVRDSVTTTENCGPTAGTFDDIYIEVWRQPVGGGPAKRIGNEKGAWAGQTGMDTYRATGAYAVSAHLDEGDQVYNLVLSDSGRFRCLASANFDAHKIGR
jgi:hypothetical protein